MNFTNAFKKLKKLALISGNELKSPWIKGTDESNIISIKFLKKSKVITMLSFSRTAVNSATNYCSFVSGLQSLKSFKSSPRGMIKLLRIWLAC